jgi:hypothetical protein
LFPFVYWTVYDFILFFLVFYICVCIHTIVCIRRVSFTIEFWVMVCKLGRVWIDSAKSDQNYGSKSWLYAELQPRRFFRKKSLKSVWFGQSNWVLLRVRLIQPILLWFNRLSLKGMICNFFLMLSWMDPNQLLFFKNNVFMLFYLKNKKNYK